MSHSLILDKRTEKLYDNPGVRSCLLCDSPRALLCSWRPPDAPWEFIIYALCDSHLRVRGIEEAVEGFIRLQEAESPSEVSASPALGALLADAAAWDAEYGELYDEPEVTA